jgi:putative transcriptional regulator
MQQFGAYVRQLRRSKNMTQDELAKLAGLSRQFVNRLEAGEYGIDEETAPRLALALGVDADEVRERAGFVRKSQTEVPAELVSIWHRVPQDRRSGFLRAVRSMGEALSL